MEETAQYRLPIIGIVLVLLGVALLLDQMEIIAIGGWTLLWVGLGIYGGATVARSFVVRDRRKVFIGTLLFLAGILFTLRRLDLVAGAAPVIIPAFIVMFGLGFFMLFVFDPHDAHLLIPAVLFVGLGAALMMTELGYWYVRDVWHTIGTYWPLLLVLAGVMMLLRKRNV